MLTCPLRLIHCTIAGLLVADTRLRSGEDGASAHEVGALSRTLRKHGHLVTIFVLSIVPHSFGLDWITVFAFMWSVRAGSGFPFVPLSGYGAMIVSRLAEVLASRVDEASNSMSNLAVVIAVHRL